MATIENASGGWSPETGAQPTRTWTTEVADRDFKDPFTISFQEIATISNTYGEAEARAAMARAEAERARIRGITPEQNTRLEKALYDAQVAANNAKANMKPGDSGRVVFDATMKALGAIEPWMGKALASEMQARGGDPTVGVSGGKPGMLVTDAAGRTINLPFPDYWTPEIRNVFAELTQDPKQRDRGEYVPSPEFVPQGYSVRDPGGNPVSGLLNPVGAVVGAGADAIEGLAGGVIPNVDTSGLDQFTQPGGTGGVGGAGGVGGQYGGYQTREVPMVEGRGPTPVETIDPAVIDAIERISGRTPQMEAAVIDPVTKTQVSQVRPVQQAQGTTIDPIEFDPVKLAEYERITGVKLDPAVLAEAAKIRREEQAAMRAKQLEVLSQLEAAARGEAPSVAQLMLKRQTEENLAQQRGLAAQARGSMIGLAAMNAASNVGVLNQRAALDQAILRAQEIATARGQLGDATGRVREQDLQLETAQAGFEQQTTLANQGAQNTRSIKQGEMDLTTQQSNQSVGAQTSQFNAGQINTRGTEKAKVDLDRQQSNQSTTLQVSLANAKADLDRAIKDAELAQQAYLADASAENLRALEQAKLKQRAAEENLKVSYDAIKTDANAENTRSIQQAGLNQDANKTNQSAINTGRQFDVTTGVDIDKANQGATLTGRGLDDGLDASLRGDSLTKRGQDIDIEKTKIDADTKNNQTRAILAGGGLETLGALGGTLIKSSDERAKTSIKIAEDDIQAFLDAMSATDSKSWKYKRPADPRAGTGRGYGKMAQDLETSAVGKTFVREDSDGTKVIDVKDAIGPMLAALAQVNARLNKIEKRRR